MPKAYVKLGLDPSDVDIIATAWTVDTQTEVTLDDDTVDFTKPEGYKYYADDKGVSHIKFDEDKYDAYIKQQKQEEATAQGQALLVQLRQIAVLNSATDEQAYIMRYLYPEWSSESVSYKKDERLIYEDKFYKVLQGHTSQADWAPDKATSLFVEISDPNEEWPQYKQPTGAHDAYMKGDKVTFENKHYISLADNNVYSPKDYPSNWEEKE